MNEICYVTAYFDEKLQIFMILLQGVKMLRRFKQILNPAQVFDLIKGGPHMGYIYLYTENIYSEQHSKSGTCTYSLLSTVLFCLQSAIVSAF